MAVTRRYFEKASNDSAHQTQIIEYHRALLKKTVSRFSYANFVSAARMILPNRRSCWAYVITLYRILTGTPRSAD
jgi:hypothetical protein